MQLYLVHGFIRTLDTYETFSYWVSSESEARQKQDEIYSRKGLAREVKIDLVRVPTDKAGMLKFLNEGQHI